MKQQPYFHAALPTEYNHLIIKITRGAEFTPFEKLVKPFDTPKWIITIVTFIAGFLVIAMISAMPKFVEQFVFGTYVRDPVLGMMQIFFGIGFVNAHGRNFSRFMFMMFTILCLVIRTVYQGKMFDLLQYDVKQPAAESLKETIERQIPVKNIKSAAFENDNNEIIEIL